MKELFIKDGCIRTFWFWILSPIIIPYIFLILLKDFVEDLFLKLFRKDLIHKLEYDEDDNPYCLCGCYLEDKLITNDIGEVTCKKCLRKEE